MSMCDIIPPVLVMVAIVASYFAFRRRPERSKLDSIAHQLEGPFRRRR